MLGEVLDLRFEPLVEDCDDRGATGLDCGNVVGLVEAFPSVLDCC